MSFFRKVMETKEAKEAIGEGLVQLAETGDLDKGIDAMFARGNKNGSAPAALLAIILDALGISEKEENLD